MSAFRSRSRSKSPPKTAAPPEPTPVPKKKFKPFALKKDEIAAIAQSTNWDEREIKALGVMYGRYYEGGDCPVERLRDMPETSSVPLFHRVLQRYNEDHSGLIPFAEFARAMSALSPRATLEEKLELAFGLFDVNDSGRVEASEVFEMLRMMVGTIHDDNDLQSIVDEYMKRFPEGMGLQDFMQMVDVGDLSKLTLNV